MASWPRDILPKRPRPFVMPGALESWGQSGKAQARSTTQIGISWTETYPTFLASSPAGRKLIAFINNVRRNGLGFDIDLPLHATPNGGATGTIRVNGANQTGSILNVDGVTGSSPGLRAGDVLTVAGLSNVFETPADVPIVGGAMAIPINPPIFAGGSPADNAIVTITGVRVNARISGNVDIPDAGEDGFIAGLTVTFRESP